MSTNTAALWGRMTAQATAPRPPVVVTTHAQDRMHVRCLGLITTAEIATAIKTANVPYGRSWMLVKHVPYTRVADPTSDNGRSSGDAIYARLSRACGEGVGMTLLRRNASRGRPTVK